MIKDFVALILTYKRPNNVRTYKTLRDCGYTGPIRLVVGNDDPTLSEYIKIFGDQVVVFDKKSVAESVDLGDNFSGLSTVLIARNACFNLAKEIGFRYFIELDDDYNSFAYRFDNEAQYYYAVIRNLDLVLKELLEFFKSCSIISSLALSQGGDFIGGGESTHAQQPTLLRKCMNSFICSIDRPFKFMGRMNDDVNTYVVNGNRGGVFFTTNHVCLFQQDTQASSGGLTDMYLELGTYVKSFYTVMYAPSCSKIRVLHTTHSRIHHRISWDNAVPKILSETHKKKS